MLSGALAVVLLAGVLGGSYPAFYLSKFKTAEVFKTAGGSTRGGHAGIRSGLVVFQFSASIALMLGAFTVYRQLEYAQKQSQGLKRENILLVENARNLGTEAAREELRTATVILSCGLALRPIFTTKKKI